MTLLELLLQANDLVISHSSRVTLKSHSDMLFISHSCNVIYSTCTSMEIIIMVYFLLYGLSIVMDENLYL